jgi:hypothetical protein
MLEIKPLPEFIRIKYCLKGDKHFRLFNCPRKELNFDKISSLVSENNDSFRIKMYISSSKLKDEILVTSDDEFRKFLCSKTFNNYYNCVYNCLKIQFIKEIYTNRSNSDEKRQRNNEIIMSDKIAKTSFAYIINHYLNEETAKKDLVSYIKNMNILPSNTLAENTEKLVHRYLETIKENFDNFLESKLSSEKVKLEVNIENLEENNVEYPEFINFSTLYDINEMNLVSNEEIIRNSSVFRTKKL